MRVSTRLAEMHEANKLQTKFDIVSVVLGGDHPSSFELCSSLCLTQLLLESQSLNTKVEMGSRRNSLPQMALSSMEQRFMQRPRNVV